MKGRCVNFKLDQTTGFICSLNSQEHIIYHVKMKTTPLSESNISDERTNERTRKVFFLIFKSKSIVTDEKQYVAHLYYFKTKPKETDKLVESTNVRGNLTSIESEEISKQVKQVHDEEGKRRRKYRVWKPVSERRLESMM